GIARNWILDRLQRDSEIVAQPRRALQPVDRHVERHELRLEQRREGRRQNFERKAARLSRADGEQRFPLHRGSSFVNEEANGSVAFMNRFWPRGGKGETETVERKLVVLSALDFPNPDAVTKAGRRWRGKFARATIIAVAGLEIGGVKKPFLHTDPLVW